MKPLIISIGVDGRERYSEKISKLEKSLKYWYGDADIHKSFPDWVIPHSSIPYAFKYDLISDAMLKGRKKIFWLDSSMRLVEGRSICDLLEQSESGIVAFENIGHPLEKYINDTAINNLGINSLKGVKQIWGGCTFWDFTKRLPHLILDEIKQEINKGSFNDDNTNRKDFIAHRHDQAILSWLLHKHNVDLLPYGKLVSAEHARTKQFGNDYYFIYGD